jgi:hypothetical protein
MQMRPIPRSAPPTRPTPGHLACRFGRIRLARTRIHITLRQHHSCCWCSNGTWPSDVLGLPVESRLVPDRAHTVADTPLAWVERDVRVVRYLSEGWSGVLWSDLDESCADAVITAQVQRFSELVTPWEWKHYSYDRPTDLPDRLRAAGFTLEPTETLLVADLADLRFDTPHLRDVVIRMVTDQPGVAALVAVHHAVFCEEASALGRTCSQHYNAIRSR